MNRNSTAGLFFFLMLVAAGVAFPAAAGKPEPRPAPAAGAFVRKTPARRAHLQYPTGLAIDASGRLYVAERAADRVRRIDPATGAIETIAGLGVRGYSGDGGPATRAMLNAPTDVAIDAAGNVVISDTGNERIRRVDMGTGLISTLAGNGTEGYSGDLGPAAAATLHGPHGVCVDRAGNLYVADSEGHRIRRVDAVTGEIRTVAGTGDEGESGDGGPAIKAAFRRPEVVAIGPAGDLVIGDSYNHRIRRVDGGTGLVTTIAGTGEEGRSAIGTPGAEARFKYFGAIILDGSGGLIVSEWGNNRLIRLAPPDYRIDLVAGGGHDAEDAEPGTARATPVIQPAGLAVDGEGNIYFVESDVTKGLGRIRRIDATTGAVTTVAGNV